MPVGLRRGGARRTIRAVLNPESPPTRIPSSITISPSPFDVTEAGTVPLTAEVRDQLGDVMVGEAVTWGSSNAGVASVHATTGVVTGVASGSCSITATASNGANVTAGAACTVSPAAVGSVTVSPTSLSLVPGATAVLTATVWTGAGGTGSILTGRTVTWASSNGALATVTTPGQTATVTAVAAGTPNITATCETVAATAVPVTVTTPSAGDWANEPTGLAVICDVDAGTRPMTGWEVYQGGNNVTVLSDWSADPISPPGALRINIPTGYSGGGGPEHQEIDLDGLNIDELFLAFPFELSSNFDATTQPGSGSPSGSQKFFHVWPYSNSGPSTMVVVAVFGTSTSWTVQFRNQNFHSSNPAGVSYNVTGGAGTNVTRGTPHTIEAYMKINTGSAADGICRLWLDGVLRLNRTNLVYNTTGLKRFNKVQLNPTVQNGVVGSNPAWKSNVDQSITFGHVYLSGA